ncbi:Lipoprotein [Pseudomonas soli]
MAYATGLFPLLVADQVGPDNELQDTQEGGANQRVCTIFWLLPPGDAKQAGDQAGEC